MENVSIDTTQQVQLDYKVAGIGDRIFAYFLDAIVIAIYIILATVGLIETVGGANTGAFFLLILIPPMFYHLLFEVFWNGQSLGKRALGIKVVKTDGARPGIGSYLLRWIFRILEITMTSGMVALSSILFNGKGQRLGDMAAGTTVIKNRKTASLSQTMLADVEEHYEPKYTSAAELSDNDVAIIRDVLNARYDYDRSTYFVMLLQTQKRVAQKLDITVPEGTDAHQFLRTILKDYNYLYGGQA